MTTSNLAARKHVVEVGDARVSYLDEGDGDPVLLLHGCPFSSYVWRAIIPRLSDSFRCIAPDLRGLGDTETPPGADWSVPAQAATILGLLDALGIDSAHVVGHDQGGAIAQLLAAHHPGRVRRLVLSNVEAYDNWPSAEERPFLRATQLPVLGPLVLWAWSRRPLFKLALTTGKAVHNPRVLTAALLDGYLAANLATRHRRGKTRRYLACQLDPANNRATTDALPALRRFDHPTLLIWGAEDPHFGPHWADRLRADIPGATHLELLPGVGHLVMEEAPERFAALVADFLTTTPEGDTA